ncbi:acetyl-CoA carboxylase biotin carboxylase subunit family protein [Streptomyces sp. NPDC056149]|uniref:ATP-grasp domain-containing protein n=1 Tax=Streptomyces sp. NPDC056149 TaxID=3345728 RepID=UPI0035D5B247
MTRQVLLLNSDKPEALRALAHRPDLRVRVITRESYAPLYAGHDTVCIDSFEDLAQVERAAYDLTRGAPVDHVIAATEKSIVPAGLIRSLLGVPGPTFDEALWSAHKRAMKQRLRAAGLTVTDFAQITSVDEIPTAARTTGWPVVAKPVLGSGTRCTHRIDSAEEFARQRAAGTLDDLADRGLPVQVERLVDVVGEYHCDGIVRDGGVTFAATSRYFAPLLTVQAPLRGGHLVDPAHPLARQLPGLLQEVAQALRIRDGVLHLEVFETADGPVIGEVTSRPPGSGVPRMWQRALGIDLWAEFIRAALGEEPACTAPRQPDRIHAWTHLPDTPGLLDWLIRADGVRAALPPAENGSAHIEVQFTAPDAEQAGFRQARLHALAEAART